MLDRRFDDWLLGAAMRMSINYPPARLLRGDAPPEVEQMSTGFRVFGITNTRPNHQRDVVEPRLHVRWPVTREGRSLSGGVG